MYLILSAVLLFVAFLLIAAVFGQQLRKIRHERAQQQPAGTPLTSNFGFIVLAEGWNCIVGGIRGSHNRLPARLRQVIGKIRYGGGLLWVGVCAIPSVVGWIIAHIPVAIYWLWEKKGNRQFQIFTIVGTLTSVFFCWNWWGTIIDFFVDALDFINQHMPWGNLWEALRWLLERIWDGFLVLISVLGGRTQFGSPEEMFTNIYDWTLPFDLALPKGLVEYPLGLFWFTLIVLMIYFFFRPDHPLSGELGELGNTPKVPIARRCAILAFINLLTLGFLGFLLDKLVWAIVNLATLGLLRPKLEGVKFIEIPFRWFKLLWANLDLDLASNRFTYDETFLGFGRVDPGYCTEVQELDMKPRTLVEALLGVHTFEAKFKAAANPPFVVVTRNLKVRDASVEFTGGRGFVETIMAWAQQATR